jgi:hypothetical protein
MADHPSNTNQHPDHVAARVQRLHARCAAWGRTHDRIADSIESILGLGVLVGIAVWVTISPAVALLTTLVTGIFVAGLVAAMLWAQRHADRAQVMAWAAERGLWVCPTCVHTELTARCDCVRDDCACGVAFWAARPATGEEVA